MPAAKTVVAVTHFTYADKDKEVHVHAGEKFTSTHPAVKRYPTWFKAEGHDVKSPRSKSPRSKT
jgi:hypothetical protein